MIRGLVCFCEHLRTIGRQLTIQRGPGIAISSFYHLHEVIDQANAVVSILGGSDHLAFPDVGDCPVLRLAFDDVVQERKGFTSPAPHHIDELIEFSRRWNGFGTMLVHCRAGSGRSPAAGMIVAGALGLLEWAARILAAKSYFTPNRLMLELADARLGLAPGLVALSRSVMATKHRDGWEPIWIPLKPPPETGATAASANP